MSGRLVQVVIAAALVALAAWVWVGPETSREARPAAEVVVSPEQACREWGKATLAMADRLDVAFARHARAHADYKAGKITQGQVFAIWNQTLHSGRLHSGHYKELRAAWRKSCLAET